MTKQELNRDIKHLRMYYLKARETLEGENFFQRITDKIEPEFKRLYRADSNAEYMNQESFRFMYRVNLIHKFIPLHMFMISMDI
jgi:hypothetical protein